MFRNIFSTILFYIYICYQLVSAQEIPLIITQYDGTYCSEKWVENGIPIPQSTVFNANQLSLWKDGSQIEADFHPLAYWADGSIRWTKIAFKLEGISGYSIRIGTPNNTTAGNFSATKSGETWTVTTGAIRFTMKENSFNLFDELWISTNCDNNYDKQLIHSGSSNGPGNLNGTITLIENGPVSKRFFFKQNYSAGEVGSYMWITAYKNSGKVTLEYTIRNG